MTENIASYPRAFDNILIGKLESGNFYKNDSLRAETETGQALFSPPRSRSSSPPRLVQDETQPHRIGKKTSDSFDNPFDYQLLSPPPSIRRQTLEDPPVSDSPITNAFFANPFGRYEEMLISREPSLLNPSKKDNELFVPCKSPTPIPPPKEYSPHPHPITLPPLEQFLPPITALQDPVQSAEVMHQWNSPSPTRSSDVVDSPTEMVAATQPPLPINPDHNTYGLTPVFREFSILDELPSVVPSPIASSPATPRLTTSPTPPRTPDSPNPIGGELPEHAADFDDTDPASKELSEGSVIGPVQLIRLLGQGSFSNVWLARDVDHIVENGCGKQGSKRLRDSTAQRSKRGDRTSHGLRPPPPSVPMISLSGGSTLVRGQSVYFAAKEAVKGGKKGWQSNLVAVKIMDCAICDTDDRTRISFVREVEVLRHISHPSIVSYLHHFSTPNHHCLVLEAVRGGELFELIGQKDNYARMTEPLTRRIFGELCHAMGWMHSVGLVHRDVKLENILFTTNPFDCPAPALNIPLMSQPLIKLTDFGLARFIDPAAPLLTTRCGSEFYAAPEIILNRPYDGRQTDSWACGVVLYALATSTLPFDQHNQWGSQKNDTRRGYLMRIARGEYTWPDDEEMARHHLKVSDGLKRVVGRLLVRDPAKRSRIADIWDEEWMRAEGAPACPMEEVGRLNGDEIPKVAREESV